MYFTGSETLGDFMDRNRKEIAQKWQKLADLILKDEDTVDIGFLKEEHLKIYEDLVRLELHNSEQEKSPEPVEHPPQQPEMMTDSPDPMSEEDEIILGKPEAEDMTPQFEEPTKKEETERVPEDTETKKKQGEEQEYPTLSDLFVPTFNDIKEDMSQKEEFKDTVSLDETEKLFETRKEEIRQLSLNDRLVSNSIQIGLNDRIAFVNKLFNFSQSDFNKVLTRLNACKTQDEALHYVQYQVKTNYNWKGKEDLEERFISLIERKFMT